MRVGDDLLHYYQRELAYLREQGADFARRYPKVAARLALGGAESPDPHTERLIEAQAFLAARVHRDLDREFPQVAMALLENLCPTLSRPVPSMTVAALRADSRQGKITSGLRVPRHTPLRAVAASGEVCRLRSAWDLTLWPLQVTQVRLVEGRQLAIRLRCDEGTDLAELELDRLAFHVHGEGSSVMPLYELLLTAVSAVAVEPGGGGAPWPLPASAWREMGFGPEGTVLPLAPHDTPAYALLQEYFAFPRKFHFFELSGLRGRLGQGRECVLRLTLRGAVPAALRPDDDSLRLGCVPAVNLFAQTSEPLRIDHRQHEYPLRADHAQESTTEVHSVLAVTASDPQDERSREIPPFAALDPDAGGPGPKAFWTARREATLRPGLSGSALWLSFVDPQLSPARLSEPVVFARLMCTNRRLAEQLAPGTALQVEGQSAALQARCLYAPSAQRPAPLAASAQWRLVSLLRLNHGALVDGSDGAETLRGLLRLFGDDSARDLAQVRGLSAVAARPATARIGQDAWRGHCRGTEVDLSFDEEAFVGGSPLLLSAVLARFFALYTTINAFVRLRVRRRDEVWHQWPPMSGHQSLV